MLASVALWVPVQSGSKVIGDQPPRPRRNRTYKLHRSSADGSRSISS